jgi:hypothetical protein
MTKATGFVKPECCRSESVDFQPKMAIGSAVRNLCTTKSVVTRTTALTFGVRAVVP